MKNETEDVLDITSGSGLVSYDIPNNKLLVELSSRKDLFNFYLNGTTAVENKKVLFPVQIKMFTADLNETTVSRSFMFKNGIKEISILEFLTVSDGVEA